MLGETPAYKTSLLSWAIAALLVVVAASGTALVLNNTNGMLSASGNDSGNDPVEADSTPSQDPAADELTPVTSEEDEPSTSLTVSDVSFAFESLNLNGSEDFSFTLEDQEGTVYEIAGDQATQEVTVTATAADGAVESETMSMEEFMIMMEEEEDPCADEDEEDWSNEDEDEGSDEEDWSDEDEGADEDDWSDEDEDEGSDEDDWSDEDEDEGSEEDEDSNEDEEVLRITMNFETEEVTITYVDENGDEQTETMGLEEFMAEMEDEDDPCADEDEENWSDEDEDEGSDEDEDDWSDEDEDEGSGQEEEVLSITMNFETEEVTITYVDENGDEQTETVDEDDFHSILEEWFEEDEDADDEEDDWFDDEEESENEEDDSAEEDASTESEDVR